MYPVPPIREDYGVPVFSASQLETYGEPDHYGIWQYTVIVSSDSLSPMVVDFQFENDHRGSLRPIHRYCRLKRFESILFQLLGQRGDVPEWLIFDIDEQCYLVNDPWYVWESVRCYLKDNKLKRYYNRIPAIIRRLGFKPEIQIGDSFFIENVITDFKKMSAQFDRHEPDRKYFPNLRFVALKLLELNGAVFNYYIPFIRTPRIKLQLEQFISKYHKV